MQKRGRIVSNKFGKSMVFGQIFLIITSVFAFAFIVGESERVSGQASIGLSNLAVASGSTGLKGTIASGTATVKGVTTQIEGVSYVLKNGLYTFKDSAGKIIAEGVSKESISITGPIKTNSLPGTEEGFLEGLFGETPFGLEGTFGHLTSGLIWGAVAYGAVYMLAGLFGASESQASAAATSAGVAVIVGRFGFLEAGGAQGSGIFHTIGFETAGGAFAWTAGIGIVLFLVLYKGESVKNVNFQCLPWEAPIGGNSCEDCNSDPFRPCSEYRCKSLGQACNLVNEGTEEEKCIWENPGDTTSPTITPWEEVLTEGHKFTNHDTRPSSRGTKIIRESSGDGCLQAFTPLTFGFTTDEPAQCKLDILHKDKLEEMNFFVGNSNFYRLNHTQTMALPSPDALNSEAPELENDGIYNLFVRCRDKNGNENVDEFAIQMCIDPSPDTTPPLIVDTSILDESPVAFGVEETPLDIYVNEPSECKWSRQDKSYDDMENLMSCATSLTQINTRELYTCSTTLTGIENQVENDFFFRCRDQPNKPENDRNTNVGSFEFTIFGTQPLNILEVGPSELMTGSTQTIPVELTVLTDDGFNEGQSICYFSSTGDAGSYIQMFETNSFEHKQTLDLSSGNYEYFFRCVDLGGNAAESNTLFDVDVDTEAPIITRVYHEIDALKLTTNEDSLCVYSLNSCNYVFEEGLEMTQNPPSVRTLSYAPWVNNQVYYIKCGDDFGNKPSPNECSMIVATTSIS